MKFLTSMAAIMMWGAVTLTSAQAQDPATSAQVTQEELAQLLVNVTGLARFLPSPATAQENFAALLANGISPADGWVVGKVVTKADLARVTVQALGKADEIANPDDPNAWVAYLKENGIPIDTVGQAVDNVSPITEPVAGYVFAAGLTTDPLKKIQVFGEPDEKQFGASVASVNPSGFSPVAPPVVPPPLVTPTPRRPTPAATPVTRPTVRRVIRQIPTPEPPTVPMTEFGGEGSAFGRAIIQAIIDNLLNPPQPPTTPTETETETETETDVGNEPL